MGCVCPSHVSRIAHLTRAFNQKLKRLFVRTKIKRLVGIEKMDRISGAVFNWLALALAGDVGQTREAAQYWLDEPRQYWTNPPAESEAEQHLRHLLAQTETPAEAYVRALLACGADPRIPNEDGATALMLAAERDDLGVIDLLLPLSDPKLNMRAASRPPFLGRQSVDLRK